MEQYLNKLGKVEPGGKLTDTVTAKRLNAIQDAIKALARGENIKSGAGLSIKKGINDVRVNAHTYEPRRERRANYFKYLADGTEEIVPTIGQQADELSDTHGVDTSPVEGIPTGKQGGLHKISGVQMEGGSLGGRLVDGSGGLIIPLTNGGGNQRHCLTGSAIGRPGSLNITKHLLDFNIQGDHMCRLAVNKRPNAKETDASGIQEDIYDPDQEETRDDEKTESGVWTTKAKDPGEFLSTPYIEFLEEGIYEVDVRSSSILALDHCDPHMNHHNRSITKWATVGGKRRKGDEATPVTVIPSSVFTETINTSKRVPNDLFAQVNFKFKQHGVWHCINHNALIRPATNGYYDQWGTAYTKWYPGYDGQDQWQRNPCYCPTEGAPKGKIYDAKGGSCRLSGPPPCDDEEQHKVEYKEITIHETEIKKIKIPEVKEKEIKIPVLETSKIPVFEYEQKRSYTVIPNTIQTVQVIESVAKVVQQLKPINIPVPQFQITPVVIPKVVATPVKLPNYKLDVPFYAITTITPVTIHQTKVKSIKVVNTNNPVSIPPPGPTKTIQVVTYKKDEEVTPLQLSTDSATVRVTGFRPLFKDVYIPECVNSGQKFVSCAPVDPIDISSLFSIKAGTVTGDISQASFELEGDITGASFELEGGITGGLSFELHMEGVYLGGGINNESLSGSVQVPSGGGCNCDTSDWTITTSMDSPDEDGCCYVSATLETNDSGGSGGSGGGTETATVTIPDHNHSHDFTIEGLDSCTVDSTGTISHDLAIKTVGTVSHNLAIKSQGTITHDLKVTDPIVTPLGKITGLTKCVESSEYIYTCTESTSPESLAYDYKEVYEDKTIDVQKVVELSPIKVSYIETEDVVVQVPCDDGGGSDWDGAKDYKKGDMVLFQGEWFEAIKENAATGPDEDAAATSEYWKPATNPCAPIVVNSITTKSEDVLVKSGKSDYAHRLTWNISYLPRYIGDSTAHQVRFQGNHLASVVKALPAITYTVNEVVTADVKFLNLGQISNKTVLQPGEEILIPSITKEEKKDVAIIKKTDTEKLLTLVKENEEEMVVSKEEIKIKVPVVTDYPPEDDVDPYEPPHCRNCRYELMPPGAWADSGSARFLLEVTRRDHREQPDGKDPYTDKSKSAYEKGNAKGRLIDPVSDLVIRFMDVQYKWKEFDGHDVRVPNNSVSRWHSNQLRFWAHTSHWEIESAEHPTQDCRWNSVDSRLAEHSVIVTRRGNVENIDYVDRPVNLPSDMTERQYKKDGTDADDERPSAS